MALTDLENTTWDAELYQTPEDQFQFLLGRLTYYDFIVQNGEARALTPEEIQSDSPAREIRSYILEAIRGMCNDYQNRLEELTEGHSTNQCDLVLKIRFFDIRYCFGFHISCFGFWSM